MVLTGSKEKVRVLHHSDEQVMTAVPGQSEESKTVCDLLPTTCLPQSHNTLSPSTAGVFLEERVKK